MSNRPHDRPAVGAAAREGGAVPWMMAAGVAAVSLTNPDGEGHYRAGLGLAFADDQDRVVAQFVLPVGTDPSAVLDAITRAAWGAVRLARAGNLGGESAVVEERDRLTAECAADGIAVDDPTTVDVAEQLDGVLERGVCSVCGTAIFGAVARRGACKGCAPELPMDEPSDLGDPEPAP